MTIKLTTIKENGEFTEAGERLIETVARDEQKRSAWIDGYFCGMVACDSYGFDKAGVHHEEIYEDSDTYRETTV